MRKKLTIALTLIATPFVLAKLIDVHLPSPEEMQMEQNRDRNNESKEAWDILNDKEASEDDKNRAQHTLMDNGEMA